LRCGARRLVATVLPALAIPEPQRPIDPWRLFPSPVRAVWLEVGFGGGEHLAWQAERHPEIGLIGSEVFLNGVASLLAHLSRQVANNVRIFVEDVRRLFPALPDACLSRVFVLFPDPWPKRRHAERRFINPANLDQLARLMADHAELRIATDDPTYRAWVVRQMTGRLDFADATVDPTVKPEDWPATRYEAKARQQGRQPVFFRYVRRPR
jgi:tRNA (guanine-N7-)-methyltransferase